MAASTPIADPDLFENDFQLSAGTIDGRNKRECPVCKKIHKVESLGAHVKKNHPAFWTSLFSIDSLQESIVNKALVKCSVAYGDHDQSFLVCLACDSIRTTDRNHFHKNGEVHLNSHLETATKMIASRAGKAYVPKSQTDNEKLLTQLDKYKRMAKMCERDHSDIGAAICDLEDAQVRIKELELMVKRLDMGNRNLESILEVKDKMMRDVADAAKFAYSKLPATDMKLIEACGKIVEKAYRSVAYKG
jgi:hypothetical protein